MHEKRAALLLSTVLLVTAVLAFACGGGDGATPPDVGGTEEPVPTRDRMARELDRALRDVGGAVSGLESRVARLRSDVERRGSREVEEDKPWFEECCDDTGEDVAERLTSADDTFTALAAIYEESGDDERMELVLGLGSYTANLEAWLAVLTTLPTNDGSAMILDEMEREAAALSEALSRLRPAAAE